MVAQKKKKSVLNVGVAGMVAGGMEIVVTYPLEYVKTAAQLEGSWAATHTGFKGGSFAYVRETIRHFGILGVYRGATPWFVFAGPRSALRFIAFEELKNISLLKKNDFLCGLLAGAVEAALLQTPNQAIQIKLVHDACSPQPKLSVLPFHRALLDIYQRYGFFNGFFCGLAPAVAKGAVTGAIRFFGYHAIVQRLYPIHRSSESKDIHQKEFASSNNSSTHSKPPAIISMLAGGVSGAISALVSQPIDTVKANLMGLDAHRYRSSFHCALSIIRSDAGPLALWQGVGPRATRVFIEVGLQFTLFEQIFAFVDHYLIPP